MHVTCVEIYTIETRNRLQERADDKDCNFEALVEVEELEQTGGQGN